MTRHSTRFLAALLAILLLPAVAAVAGDWSDCDGWDDDHDWGNKGRFCEIREMSFAAVGSLELDSSPNGGVSVKAWDRDEIKVEARITVWDRDEEDARRIAANIEIRETQGRIEAVSDERDHWSVSYRIHAPRETDLDLEAHNGGISVAGIMGHLQIETHNGGLKLDSVAGDVVARTQNGGLSVTLAGDSWEGAGLEAVTKNGGVSMEIPAGYSAELETGTVNGRISIDFPITVQGRLDRNFSTTLGSGGAPIKVRTTNGSVKIEEG